MYEPRRRKPLVARASEDERKDLLPTLALLGARRISARRLTWFAFVPTDFRGNARLLAVEVHIVCTYKGVEMHDGTRRCSRRATHAGTDFHSSTSKDILLLIKTVTKFSNVIGNHQPDLSSNRTVCAKSKLLTLRPVHAGMFLKRLSLSATLICSLPSLARKPFRIMDVAISALV